MQAIDTTFGELQVNRSVIMLAINRPLPEAGCFLPPAAITPMIKPILMPVITVAGFDPICFGVILILCVFPELVAWLPSKLRG